MTSAKATFTKVDVPPLWRTSIHILNVVQDLERRREGGVHRQWSTMTAAANVRA
ncbi:uncharacterized protein LACBIDRAFT_299830 [Laccaria bicolor S238N-H82]|uniref:Predicted protein n=1 Tax=Laccaria bicolor (strain S238N-H82 / ATCC MYA-4686) TaxID=486041 RepID=B0DFI7_LACBS|nr:uncharacterized protein LACBIDRAFT_299830 [Laccaria bicolor S238N-H82]EDR06871.1 predicted protein [Laccaria bicolor S238N-H82]|eukprot:XP_001882718.1 predicted protein [Laccaria bicolor S238N-H82]